MMNEKPIERLNYYNGQRLEADDLKLEQEYHIRVRRWLNKSLYSPGIARGLEVKAEEGTLNVIISPGLALDHEGREIILLEEERIPVIGKHNIVNSEDVGAYLTIQYREQTAAGEEASCPPRGKSSGKTGSRLAGKGPTRVLAKPDLGWSDKLPHESSGKIILARVILSENCQKIKSVESGERRYVGAASAAKVRQYALEGERHIDKDNPGRIYFHIRGRQASVTLYLRAEKFSTLYYTEIGEHKHRLDVGTDIQTSEPILDNNKPERYLHAHDLDLHTSQESIKKNDVDVPGHNHDFISQMVPIPDTHVLNGKGEFGILVTAPFKPAQDILNDIKGNIVGGGHTHPIVGSTELKGVDFYHTHNFSPTVSMENAGVNDITARSGKTEKALTFVDDLEVWIGKNKDQLENYKNHILKQLHDVQPNERDKWGKLGDGSGDHILAQKGTGPIKLDFLSPEKLSFTEGEYLIELNVKSGGGRILYNLYVE